jgi:hypothetical protein
MMMETKALVYSVLALTLGYLLVSTVPAQLAPSLLNDVQPESETLRAPSPDESTTIEGDILASEDEEPVEDLGSTSSSAQDSSKTSADAADVSGLVGDHFMVLGTLILNLSIAFAIYLLARRRFF